MRTLLIITLISIICLTDILGQGASSFEFDLNGRRVIIPMAAIDRKKNANAAICFSNGTILQTTDKGENWTENTFNSSVPLQSWMFSNKKGDLFMLTMEEHEILKVSSSADLGSSWKDMGNVELADIQGYPSLFFDPEKERILLTYLRNSDCKLDLAFIQSAGGKKWTDPVFLNSQPVSCDEAILSNADVTLGPQDFIFSVWSQENVIYMDRTYDDGKTWLRSDIAIHKRKGKGEVGQPVMTIDNSESILKSSLYVVWADSLESGYELKSSRSSNNGDYWTTPVLVHDETEVNLFAPAVAVDQSNGFLYLTYYKDLGNGTYDLYLTYSADGAQTFKANKMNDAALRIPDPEILKWSSTFDVYNGKIIVSWSDFHEGKQTLYTKSLTRDDLKE